MKRGALVPLPHANEQLTEPSQIECGIMQSVLALKNEGLLQVGIIIWLPSPTQICSA